MRLDHVAYRVACRDKTVAFFKDAFGYKVQAEFEIFFNDEKTDKAMCIALEPPEKVVKDMPWSFTVVGDQELTYHLAPEIFVSEGTPGSIVYDWVQKRDGVGGIHHLAFQVDSVEGTMQEWKNKGWSEFTSQKAMTCPGLTQCFTKPSSLTGVIFEFIERGEHGFCKENVKSLMESTREFSVAKAQADGNMK